LTLNFLKPYLPRSQRQTEIKNLFKYNCKCELCADNVRDETRAFICRKCNFISEEECGLVCPKGAGANVTDWSCNKCGESPTKDYFLEFTKLEEVAENLDVVTLKVNDLIKKRIIHPYHYIIYRALVQRVELLLNIRPTMCEKYLNWILAANARVLIPNHPERAYFYDLLAQVKKLIGDAKGCKEAYLEALSITEKNSSKNSLQLALAKQKAVNPDKVETTVWYPMKDL